VGPVGGEPPALGRPAPRAAPAPTPNAVLTSRALARSDTVLSPSGAATAPTTATTNGAANTAVIAAPETSRWRTWSVLTGVLGVLLGVAIGYASLRRDEVIPIATVPETEAIVEAPAPTPDKAVVPARASTVTSTGGR
ncbi:hypothetical protein L6R52_41080, partial [Myxococcota bacterium]|nr:hypothetical protein [Myxococcota bacterium]